MAPGASSQPSHAQLTPHGSLVSQYSSSLPSTPRQRARDNGTNSRTPSPRFGPGALSPRSVSSESNRAITSVRSVSQNCRYQWTKPALRRIPYTIGSEPLERPSSPPKESLIRTVENRLSNDIRLLYERLLPSDDSQDKRKSIVGKLEKILHDEFPGKDVEVSVFGSSGNLLFTSESDVDICIVISGLETVCTLAEMLAKRGMKKVQCVHAKAVPIVKIWDPQLELACDLNVNNLVALKNTQMVKAYIQLDERVRPLAMIIKHWSKRRKINEASGGTLSSYTWTLLIINFLQLRNPPILPVLPLRNDHGHPKDDFSADVEKLHGFGSENRESLGALLFQFFRRYGFEIDYETAVVSVRQGKIMTKKEKKWHIATNNSLCVEEPFNTDRNLGNTADDTAFRGLHLEIRQAFARLSEAQDLVASVCEQYEHPAGDTRPAFERPTPQPRPVLSRSASQSGRLARTPNANVRGSKSRFERGNGANRRASNPPNFGFHPVPSITGLHPAIGGPAFYSTLPQPRTGIHDQLNRLSEQLTAQENQLRYQQLLMSQFQLQQALLSGQQRASNATASSQQRNVMNGYPPSRHLNTAENSAAHHMFIHNQFIAPWDASPSLPGPPSSQQGNISHPSSPSIPDSTPLRRPAQRSSTPNSPGHVLRSQSQPARSVNVQQISMGYPGSPSTFVVGQGQDHIAASNMQGQTYVDAFGRTWNPTNSSVAPTAEPVRREYLGYGIGGYLQGVTPNYEFPLAQIPSYEDLQREKRRGSPLKQTSSSAFDVPLASSPTLSSTTDPISGARGANSTSQTEPHLISPVLKYTPSAHVSLPTSRDEPLILNGSYEHRPTYEDSAEKVWLEAGQRGVPVPSPSLNKELAQPHHSASDSPPMTYTSWDMTSSGEGRNRHISLSSSKSDVLQNTGTGKAHHHLRSEPAVRSEIVSITPEQPGKQPAHVSATTANGAIESVASATLATRSPDSPKSAVPLLDHDDAREAHEANWTQESKLLDGNRKIQRSTKPTRAEDEGQKTEKSRNVESGASVFLTQPLPAQQGWQPARRKGKRGKAISPQGQPDSTALAHGTLLHKDERKGG